MNIDIFLEVFGQLVSRKQEADWLYPAFNTRAEMMRWTHTQFPKPPYAWLWNMHDAELTAGQGTSRLGWVQVGLYDGQDVSPDSGVWLDSEHFPEATTIVYPHDFEYQYRYPVSPAAALPALGQCFEDALHRCVQFTWTCLQISVRSAGSDISPLPYIRGIHQWFEIAPAGSRTQAYIAFDRTFLGDYDTTTLVNHLDQEYTFPFVFGPVVTVPELHRIAVPAKVFDTDCALTPAPLGLEVTLPEWTMTAAASALALVLNTVHKLIPNIRNGILRVTRVQ